MPAAKRASVETKKVPATSKRGSGNGITKSSSPKPKKTNRPPPKLKHFRLPFYARLQNPRWPHKKVVVLPAKRKTKIEELRKMISTNFGLPVDGFELFFRGSPMNDQYDLIEYNWSDKQVINVIPKSSIPASQEKDDEESSGTAQPKTPISGNQENMQTEEHRNTVINVIPKSSVPASQENNDEESSGTTKIDDPVSDNQKNMATEEHQNTIADNFFGLATSADIDMSNNSVITDTVEPQPDSPTFAESFDKENQFFCQHCKDNFAKKCLKCACQICKKKKATLEEEEKTIIICEECEEPFHYSCVGFESVPPEDEEFYCADCKVDANEVNNRDGTKKKIIKRRFGEKSTNKANTGCIEMPDPAICQRFGPIPGIEVGQLYYDRVSACTSGVHANHMNGIVGNAKKGGAFSICTSDQCYDDRDEGDILVYTGSGGTDLKTENKRTAIQSKDQEFTKMNMALAMNCAAPFNENGADAGDNWMKGKAVRVIRKPVKGDRGKYSPQGEAPSTCRYDGIYKVKRYWKGTGAKGHIICQFELRRDDPTPPPWTEEGKKRIKDLGLGMIYPPMGDIVIKMYEDGLLDNNGARTDKPIPDDYFGSVAKPLVQAAEYILPESVREVISLDTEMSRTWNHCLQKAKEGKLAFGEAVREAFDCVIGACSSVGGVKLTLTHQSADGTVCERVYCNGCAKRSFPEGKCPYCRHDVVPEGQKMNVDDYQNNNLMNALAEVEKLLHSN